MMPNKCGNDDCGVSTAIDDETLTFGSGRLTADGFWEFPCNVCARECEAADPQYKDKCWPFDGQDIEQLSKDITKECDEEEEELRAFKLSLNG